MNKDQISYDSFVRNAPIAQQQLYSGGLEISDSEHYFIEKYAKSNVLDIGCGTGNRTLAEFSRRNIRATGIEKHSHLFEASNFKDQLIQLDIADPEFLNHPCFEEHYDCAFCFGGVINGFIDPEIRRFAWKNLSGLLARKKVDYLLVDTYSGINEFETQPTGVIHRIHPTALPPQYFYSKSELLEVFNDNALEVVEERTDMVMGTKITHFLLKHK